MIVNMIKIIVTAIYRYTFLILHTHIYKHEVLFINMKFSVYRYKQLLWLRAIIITSELISHHGKDSHSCCVGRLERVMQDAIKTYLFTIVSKEQSWSSLRELYSSLQVRRWSSIMILEIFLKQFTQVPGPRCQGQAAFWVGMHDLSWAPALHMNVDSEKFCQIHSASLRISVSLTSFQPIKQGYLQTSPQSLKQCARQLQALKPSSGQFSVSACTCVHTHTHTHTHTRLVFSWISVFSIAEEELPSSREDIDHSCRSLCTEGSSEELAVSELWGGIISLLRSYGTKLLFASFCLALY